MSDLICSFDLVLFLWIMFELIWLHREHTIMFKTNTKFNNLNMIFYDITVVLVHA